MPTNHSDPDDQGTPRRSAEEIAQLHKSMRFQLLVRLIEVAMTRSLPWLVAGGVAVFALYVVKLGIEKANPDNVVIEFLGSLRLEVVISWTVNVFLFFWLKACMAKRKKLKEELGRRRRAHELSVDPDASRSGLDAHGLSGEDVRGPIAPDGSSAEEMNS